MDDRLFCPRCGGKDIRNTWGNPFAERFGAPMPKRCQGCGYKAMFFPAEEEVKPREEAEEGGMNPIVFWLLLWLLSALAYFLLR